MKLLRSRQTNIFLSLSSFIWGSNVEALKKTLVTKLPSGSSQKAYLKFK